MEVGRRGIVNAFMIVILLTELESVVTTRVCCMM